MTERKIIGIHRKKGSFSDRWEDYCQQHQIPYQAINCFSKDIITQSNGLSAVLWHWNHTEFIEKRFARAIIASLEAKGILVFPNLATCWHYDDKVAQKFLFQAVGAPSIPTYVFFEKREALAWIQRTSWPKIFKLAAGAGSSNVHLIPNRAAARKHIMRSFSKGWSTTPSIFNDLGTRIRTLNMHRELTRKLWRLPRFLYGRIRHHLYEREIGYIYFQDFLPNNPFDTRVTIIGNRAFSSRRFNRPHDFRASGSGVSDWNPDKINLQCIEVAYDITQRIGAQSLAFDFLYDTGGNPRIGEISYCYPAYAVYDCLGFWDPNLAWHPGHVWPEDAIIEDVLLALEQKRTDSKQRVIEMKDGPAND